MESRPDLVAFEQQLAELRRELAQTRAEVARVRGASAHARMSLAALVSTVALAFFGGSMGAQTAGQKVVAPFEVVDQGGTTLMSVTNTGLGPQLRVDKAAMGTGAYGAYFVAERSDGSDMAAIGSFQGAPGVYVMDPSGKKPIAVLAQAKVGGGVAYATDSAGIIRALVSGQGEFHAADGVGRTRATMTQDGAFTARNASGVTIARFGEGAGGVGQLQLANSAGSAIVEAGQLVTGAGVVRAYPMGTPGMGVLGMPGTFIMGFLGAKK